MLRYVSQHAPGALGLLTVCLILVSAAYAQGPSSSLRQADAAYRQGQSALARNDLAAAQADFEQTVRLAPQAEQGHSALGAVLVRRGQVARGIHELETALSMNSSDAIAQQNLAEAYLQAGQPQRALPLFHRLREHHALSPLLLAEYARALAATHRIGSAEDVMQEAVAADPRNAQLHDELGSLYALQKDWPNAQQQFASAIRLDPNLAASHMHLGLSLEAQNQPGALAEMASAERLAPRNTMIDFEYAKALSGSGQDAQAIPIYQSVLRRNPTFRDAAYQLALSLQRTGQAQQAIPLFRQVVAADPDNAEALTNLGMALCQAQHAKDAVPILQRSLAIAPSSVTALQDLAAAYVQLSQFDDAVGALQKAIALAPDLSQLHYNLGLALKWKDDAADAIPELEKAERLNSSAPEAPYLLGILYMQDGRYADAAREMNRSLKLRPKNADGWATLGSVDEKLNKLPEAESALHEAIRQNPGQPDAYLTLASVLVKENQPEQARAERHLAANLMRANMNRQRALVATHSGNADLDKGNIDEAITEFQNALSYDPNYADAHLGLAAAFDRQGNTTEAALERRQAESTNAPSKP